MQIPSGNGAVTHMSKINPYTTVSPRNRAEESRGQFDQVSLSSGKSNSFQMELKSRLCQEVRTATTTGRLQELRQQVLSGEYQIDPVAIARRMLLQEGGAL